MDCTLETLSPVLRRIEAVFSASEVDAALREQGAEHQKSGCRKGHPSAVLPKTHLNDLTAARVAGSLADQAAAWAVSGGKIVPVGRFAFYGGMPCAGKPFHFTLTVEVLPELVLPEDLSSLKAEWPEQDRDENVLADFVERVRRHHAILEEQPDRPCGKGDTVFIDVRGSEGKNVPGMEAENFPLELSEPEEGIMALVWGLRAGEEREGEIACPPEYPDPALRGSNVLLRIRVRKICRRILPEIDESFAVKNGFSSLNALKQFMFEKAMEERLVSLRAQMKRKLLDALLDGMEFPVPEILIRRSMRGRRQEADRFLREGGLSEEERKAALARMEQECRRQAEQEARAAALLLALARRERLSVPEAELNRRVRAMAGETGRNPQKLREILEQTGAIRELEENILVDEAWELLFRCAEKKHGGMSHERA